MQTVLIIVQLMVSVSLVIVVLLQKSEGGALGMGGSGSGLGGFLSARGAADTLTRTTAVLAVLFFLTSLALTLIALHGRPQSFLDQNPASPLQSAPKSQHQPNAPKLPAVPAPHG